MLSWLIDPVIGFIYWLAQYLPLPLFAFFGAFIEEIIAPIPSPLVMALLGSLAAAIDASLAYLIMLILIGAIGKTIGGLVIYLIADKGEDFIMKRLGKFFGISSRELENIGKRLSGGWKDDVALFLLYVTPIIPSAPISIVCGLIKINIRTYLTSAFLGATAKNAFYFYLGHMGIDALESINRGAGDLENIGYIILLVIIGIIFANIYYHRRKGRVLNKD